MFKVPVRPVSVYTDDAPQKCFAALCCDGQSMVCMSCPIGRYQQVALRSSPAQSNTV